MILHLARLPASTLGPNDKDYKGKVPARARLMQPDAAKAFLGFQAKYGPLVVTDIYRSPQAQAKAHATRPGTQPVGYSAHGFGLAFDADLQETLEKLQFTYRQLISRLAEFGFYCHRRDLQQEESEAWHFNFLTTDASRYLGLADHTNHATWSHPVEAVIQDRYGKELVLEPDQVEAILQQMGYYGGPKNGDTAPAAMKLAIEQFQAKMGLVADGIAGLKTQRVLAVMTAQVIVEEEAVAAASETEEPQPPQSA